MRIDKIYSGTLNVIFNLVNFKNGMVTERAHTVLLSSLDRVDSIFFGVQGYKTDRYRKILPYVRAEADTRIITTTRTQ